MQLTHLLTDEQKSIKEMIRKFVDNEIMPIREEMEEDDMPDSSNRKENLVLCPFCDKPLRTPLAKQCFNCHRDWHDPNNIIKYDVDENRNDNCQNTLEDDNDNDNDKKVREALGLDD